MNQTKGNTEVHTNNIRHSIDLHLPFSRLSTHQKGAFYMGSRIFNNLPFEIKALTNNVKQFKRAFKDFLYFHSFYLLQEYLDLNNIRNYYIVLILCLFGVYSIFYSNLTIFLSFYIVSYIVTSSNFFYMSIFII